MHRPWVSHMPKNGTNVLLDNRKLQTSFQNSATSTMTSLGLRLESEDRRCQLQQAALSGDKSRVRGLLLHQGAPLVDDETKRRCLYLAVSNGDRALATRVLDVGCDVSSSLTKNADTALHLACRSPVPDLLLIRRLVQEVGTAIDTRNHNMETTLHVAAMRGHVEVAAMLLSSGAKVDVQNYIGNTPLHCAVHAEHTRMVCLLLVYGATTTCVNYRAEQPILLAAKQSQSCILRVLLKQRVTPNPLVRKALTKCLQTAILKGDRDLACLLLERDASVNGLVTERETLLHIAASRGDSVLVKVLVTAGADVNALSDDVTALHCASQRGYPDVVDILLKNGASVNTATNDCSLALTAMHLATAGRHWRVLEKLCHHKGDINSCDSAGNTSLHIVAAMSSREFQPCDVFTDKFDYVMVVLLRAGADPTIQNREGDMPHHLAAHKGNTMQLHQLVTACSSTLHIEDGFGETAMSAVMALRRTDLVILLLAHGARLEVVLGSKNEDILLDTVDRALLVYDAILNSGNLCVDDLRQYQANVHKALGETEGAFMLALASTGGQELTLKSIMRTYLRHYLLHGCKQSKLWNAICSLRIPPLIQRYLLLQDYLESLKKFM